MAKKKIALTKEDKFHSCPACFGPIDYFNTCRQCGRPWTPELDPIEKQEREEGRTPEDEEGEPVTSEPATLVGERDAAFEREKEEILGKKAKLVGTKKKALLPFKVWEIEDGDNDAEISRKHSLMKLDSHKIYNQMGLSMRAYQNLKGTMIHLSRLWTFLDNAEREAFAPTAELLKQGLMGLAELSAKKVDLAARMEEAVSRERRKIRTIRSAKSAIAIAAKKATRGTNPGADTEGFETINLTDLDPEELMEQVRIQLDLKRKHVKPRPSDFPEEQEN